MKEKTKIRFGKVLLFAIMFAGLFLALCSLASLSYMDANKLSATTPIVLRFDTVLARYQSSPVFSRINIVHLDSSIHGMWDQYQAFVNYKSVVLQDLNDDTKKRFLLIADRFETQLLRHLNLLSRQENEYLNLYNFSFQKQRKLTAFYEDAFKEQATKLPANLLAKYGDDILNYFILLPYESVTLTNYNHLSSNYSQYFQALKMADSKLKSFVSQVKAGNPVDLTLYNSPLSLPGDAEYQTVGTLVKTKVPQVPRAGEDWGIFFTPISWLVGPNNLDILLIIGMIGFALFGAAITIYVTRDLTNPEVSVSESITLVIIRGFSASIIVFLAMRGGIAIFNSGQSNPNPSLLFLFCFIGAVFSDPIWRWAKGKIDGTFVTPDQVPLKNPNLTPAANQPSIIEKE
jgi:hypothetical protein